MPNGEGIKITIELELVGKEALEKVRTEMRALKEKVEALSGTMKKTVQPMKEVTETTKKSAAEMRHGFSAIMGDLESLGNRFRYLSLVTAVTSGAMILAVKSFTQTSIQAEEAILGLTAVARAWGRDVDEANRVVQDLTKTGLINFQQAAESVRNLMAKGLDIPTTEKALKALLDRSIFAREAQYDFGEAVLMTTRGILYNREQLADATLIQNLLTKGTEEATRMFGKNAKALSEVEKALGAVNVIVRESIPFTGAAAMAQHLLSGTLGKMNAALWRVKNSIGTALKPVMGILAEATSSLADKITSLTRRFPDLTGMMMMTVTALSVLIGTLAGIGAMLPLIASGLKALKTAFGLASLATWKFGLIAAGVTVILAGLTYAVLKLTGRWNRYVGTIKKVSETMKTPEKLLEEFTKAATTASDDAQRTFEYVSSNFNKIARDFSLGLAKMARDQAKAAVDAGFAYDRLRAKFKEAMADMRKKSDERYIAEKIRHERAVEDLTERLEEERSKGLWADQAQIRDLEKRLKRENEDWERFQKEHAERLDEETKKTEESFVSQLLAIEKSLSKAGEAVDDLKGKLSGIGGVAEQQAIQTRSAFKILSDPDWWANIFRKIGNYFKNFYQGVSGPVFWQFFILEFINNFAKLGELLAAPFIGLGKVIMEALEEPLKRVIIWFRDRLNDLISAFNRALIALSRLPGMGWVARRTISELGPLPWEAPGRREQIPQWPYVPWAQYGAIVRKPTLIGVGEAGPEAIIPLNRIPSVTININNPIVREAQDIRRLAETIKDILSQRQRWAKLGAY